LMDIVILLVFGITFHVMGMVWVAHGVISYRCVHIAFRPHRYGPILTGFSLTRSWLVLIHMITLVRDRYRFRSPIPSKYPWRVLSTLADRYLEWSFCGMDTMRNRHG
jgi:hypothetical protein